MTMNSVARAASILALPALLLATSADAQTDTHALQATDACAFDLRVDGAPLGQAVFLYNAGRIVSPDQLRNPDGTVGIILLDGYTPERIRRCGRTELRHSPASAWVMAKPITAAVQSGNLQVSGARFQAVALDGIDGEATIDGIDGESSRLMIQREPIRTIERVQVAALSVQRSATLSSRVTHVRAGRAEVPHIPLAHLMRGFAIEPGDDFIEPGDQFLDLRAGSGCILCPRR